jgi:hypothetical protein
MQNEHNESFGGLLLVTNTVLAGFLYREEFESVKVFTEHGHWLDLTLFSYMIFFDSQ